MIALLDGDILAYHAAYAARGATITWGNQAVSHMHGRIEEAIATIKTEIALWTSRAGCTGYVVCVSDRERPKWRAKLISDYCANRPAKPDMLDTVYDMMYRILDPDVLVREGLEGDDLMGIYATREPDRYVIVTLDKDLVTIPGRHYHPPDNLAFEISPDLADLNWMFQTLIGDRVDNYKGCIGVGKAKAMRALAPLYLEQERDDLRIRMWHTVVGMFERSIEKYPDHYTTVNAEVEALRQARVARILRNGDYERNPARVRLWGPVERTWMAI